MATACVPEWPATTYRDLTEERQLSPEGDAEAWAAELAAKVQEAYFFEGYEAARVWWDVRDGCPRFDVDEGRIASVQMHGVGTVARFTLSDNIELLPGKIFRRDVVGSSVARVGRQREVEPVWHIQQSDSRRKNRLGQLVWRQRLDVDLGSSESVGLTIGLDTVQRFGLVTSADYLSITPKNRRFEVGLKLGTPYHRWATEQVAQLRWTYGAIHLRWHKGNEPGLRFDLEASNGIFRRLDRNLEQGYVSVGMASVQQRLDTPGDVIIQFGAGVEGTWPVLLEGENLLLDPAPQLRGLLLCSFGGERKRGPTRNDLKTDWSFDVQAGVNQYLRPLVRMKLQGRAAIPVKRSWLLVKARGILREGELHFYDDVAVGGKFQRVLFDDSYWTRRALQTEVEYKQTLSRSLAVGVWHDASLFHPEVGSRQATVVNGLGPSVQVIWNMAIVNLAYGFGWTTDSTGLGHNLSLSIATVY